MFKMYDWKSKETRFDAVESQLNEFSQEGYEIYNVIKNIVDGNMAFFLIIARLELDVAYWGKQYQKKDIELEGLEEDYKGSKEIWESVTKPLIAQKDLRIEELLKYEWEMRKQLSYLTPQGSEFVEFEECYNYIKEQLREGHEAKKQVVYERRELQSSKQELSQLKGKLSEDSLVKTIQKSIKACGGYEVYDMTDTIRKELGVGDE